MYKITLLFESNEKGIYTQEIETASDEFSRDSKFACMVERWAEILIPFVDVKLFTIKFNSFIIMSQDVSVTHDINKTSLILYDYLKVQIDILNKLDNGNRTFNIIVENIE